MLLHIQSMREVTGANNVIKLVKQKECCKNKLNYGYDFYIEINGEYLGKVYEFEAEDKDISFDCSLKDYFIDVLEDEVEAFLVLQEDCEDDFYSEEMRYHIVFRINVNEKLIKKQANVLKEKKESLDYNKKKAFIAEAVNKMLSSENIDKAIGYCKDMWSDDLFGMNYCDIRNKFGILHECPFDNNAIVGAVHHLSNIGWGCYYRCRLHAVNSSLELKTRLLTQYLENVKNDVYRADNLSMEKEVPRLLSKDDLRKLNVILQNNEEEKERLYQVKKEYEKDNLIKLKDCPNEFFKEFKYLNDNNFLSDNFKDFKFLEDRITYTRVDCDFSEEQVEINNKCTVFSIMPSVDGHSYEITIGDGCCVTINEPITADNKESLENFYNKCKSYQVDSPVYYKEIKDWEIPF